MSKIVAVFDTEEVVGCPLEHEGFCHIVYEQILDHKYMKECDGLIDKRPEWCPLRQLPEKWEEKPYNSDFRKQWQRGYNHAIDDICGVVDEQEAMNEYYAARLSRFD